jgi:AI-2 transport protein TqsA
MRLLVTLVCIGILLALLHLAASVVTPLLLAATLAIAFQPLAIGMARRGLPPVVAAVVTTVLVLGVVAAAGALFYVAASDLAGNLPHYQERLETLKTDLAIWLDGREMRGVAASVRRFDLTAPATRILQSSFFQATAFLQGLFLVVVTTAFMQMEASVYRRKLVRALGDKRSVRWLDGGLREVQRYLVIKAMISLANGVLLGAWCWLWGIDNPLLWGVLAFILNFIPVIGSIIAAVPPILLGFVDGGAGIALGVASGYLLVNLLVDNILEPRIMGHTLGLSPLVVLLSMLIWGFVLGPVGAILSVPLTMAVKILFERDEDLKRLALLMGDGSEIGA